MSKENLKTNVVAAPTLFIGAGGTGCRILKRMAEMCRPGETENISFVGLDTNVNDLAGLAGSSARIYHIQTSSTQTVGDYLNYDQDALKNWFPKNAVMYDKTVSEGAGQVRAISRLALNATIKTGNIAPLYDAVDDLFRKTGQEMKQALRVVIVSTASGGTGSGIILPLSMLVRDYVKTKYPNTGIIVRALILLPETLDSVIKSTVEKESQRRNAYATIKEINAFMMKGSGILDVDEDVKRYQGLHIDFSVAGSEERKSLALLPFDFCFLMDGQNAEDSTLVNIKQYEVQAARSLYEQNIGPMQKDAFSVEDNIIKELANPGNYGRNRFGGIGASVLRYPYEDVADYIAYDWAMDSIGGEGEAAKWSKYDNAYNIKSLEARKKDLPESERPKREDVYVQTLNTASDNFSKDLRSKYLNGANKRVKRYFDALAAEMHQCLNNNSAISGAKNAANGLAEEIDYNANAEERSRATENLSTLRDYETAIRMNARRMAESTAESIFQNEKPTIVEKHEYTLEALIKNAQGEICHPNAARYMLYLVKSELEKRVNSVTAEITDVIDPELQSYSPEASDVATFDVKGSKKKEKNFDELCAAAVENDEAGLFKKMGGSEQVYKQRNELFPAYYEAITNYGNKVAELEAYKIGFEYVKDLCEMYERFFRTFGEKITALLRKQDDLVDALKFNKGDSEYNICSSRALLDELSRSTRNQREEGAMLDSELNGKIFDAVKDNVRFEREIRNQEVVEVDRRVDVFDDILLGYFKEDVRRNCDSIDVNVIEALAMEKRISARVKLREEQGDGAKLFDKVTQDDCLRHISEMIAMGSRLAAPSIQRLRNVEPREINLCAYNQSLDEMRNYRMSALFPKGVSAKSTDTVSRYELHFFNALYNLTPDKLSKFACESTTETRKRKAGLYHNAYITYSSKIGPDSTKDMLISTHIDKRWDSISVMPELDFDFQERQMMNIHQALIYGLVHQAITFRNYSLAAGSKKVYKYQDSNERYVDLIVSNGTLCDEFYEILDSLYISSAIVGDIGVIRDRKRQRDIVRNSDYAKTTFAKDLAAFYIEENHEGPTSLFEIPLAYYNSLPNSIRFTGEITSLVNAVIKTLRDELTLWENETDVRFLLCSLLQEQFLLLMDNYHKYEKLQNNLKASDNPVIDIIFRKIKDAMSTTPEPDDYEEVLNELKSAIC